MSFLFVLADLKIAEKIMANLRRVKGVLSVYRASHSKKKKKKS